MDSASTNINMISQTPFTHILRTFTYSKMATSPLRVVKLTWCAGGYFAVCLGVAKIAEKKNKSYIFKQLGEN